MTSKGNTNKQVNQKGNNKKSPEHRNNNKYDWKKVPPKQVKKEIKTMDGKNYNWCKWHKAWVEHDPEVKGCNECRLCKKLEE